LFYDGDWQVDAMHGQGTLIDDYVYTGDFRHHKKHGKGIWSETEDGSGDIYDGEWKDNEREGQGTCTYSEDKEVYTGQWVKDKREGQGVMTDKAGGVIYNGDWVNDDKHGQGEYIYLDEYTYVGEFDAGLRCGKGWVEYTDGDVYDGDWKGNERSGEGTCSYAGRDPPHVVSTYVGYWQRDAKDGEGALTSGGTVLRGTWQSGRMHGAFIRSIDGAEKQEQWVNGVQIEGDVASSSS